MQAGLEQLERLEAVPLAKLVVEAALQQTRDEAPDGAAAATPAVQDEDKLATEATQVGFARLLAVDLAEVRREGQLAQGERLAALAAFLRGTSGRRIFRKVHNCNQSRPRELLR